MEYSVLKSIHIIFMVSYFAGIFYLVRLFVYHVDAEAKDEVERKILQKQYVYMIRRLWNIIVVPGGVLMLIFGVWILILRPWLFQEAWFHVKLTFLLFLLGFHLWSWRKIKQIKQGTNKDSSVKLRMMNEVATFLLFAIVFAVILKGLFIENWLLLLLSFLGLILGISLIVKLVNKNKR
ncbi:MAG: CopD family protein [Flavobacteriales bacterium]|nr:CopD family protein [Flavobacteriales bacterium]